MLVCNIHLFYSNLINIPESQQCHSYTFIKTVISDNACMFNNSKAAEFYETSAYKIQTPGKLPRRKHTKSYYKLSNVYI